MRNIPRCFVWTVFFGDVEVSVERGGHELRDGSRARATHVSPFGSSRDAQQDIFVKLFLIRNYVTLDSEGSWSQNKLPRLFLVAEISRLKETSLPRRELWLIITVGNVDYIRCMLLCCQFGSLEKVDYNRVLIITEVIISVVHCIWNNRSN